MRTVTTLRLRLRWREYFLVDLTHQVKNCEKRLTVVTIETLSAHRLSLYDKVYFSQVRLFGQVSTTEVTSESLTVSRGLWYFLRVSQSVGCQRFPHSFLCMKITAGSPTMLWARRSFLLSLQMRIYSSDWRDLQRGTFFHLFLRIDGPYPRSINESLFYFVKSFQRERFH